jgi:hypothetical protein
MHGLFTTGNCRLLRLGYNACISRRILAPSLSRMGFDPVYPVYYETGYTLSKPIRERLGASLQDARSDTRGKLAQYHSETF